MPSDAVTVPCPKCRGTGREEIVSFFSPEMMQDVSIPCRRCGGDGIVRKSADETGRRFTYASARAEYGTKEL